MTQEKVLWALNPKPKHFKVYREYMAALKAEMEVVTNVDHPDDLKRTGGVLIGSSQLTFETCNLLSIDVSENNTTRPLVEL